MLHMCFIQVIETKKVRLIYLIHITVIITLTVCLNEGYYYKDTHTILKYEVL